MGKIYVLYITDKCLVSRIYKKKKLLKTNEKNTNKSVERQQNNDYHLTKKKPQKAMNIEVQPVADNNSEQGKAEFTLIQF